MTSQDLLFFSLSLCVIWLTIFLCFVLYYLAAILRRIYKMIQIWEEGLQKISETIEVIKKKMEHTISSLTLIAEGMKQVIEFLIKKRKKGEKGETRIKSE